MKGAFHRLRSAARALQSWAGAHLSPLNRPYYKRRWKGTQLLWSIPAPSRARFNDETLLTLLDAGWREGRQWDSLEQRKFQTAFQRPCPELASDVLREFGGLTIGFPVPDLWVGAIQGYLLPNTKYLERLVGSELFPIGETTFFATDGLVVLMDVQGRVFVDGDMGEAPPHDRRVDLVACSMDDFLNGMHGGVPLTPRSSWYYSLPASTER